MLEDSSTLIKYVISKLKSRCVKQNIKIYYTGVIEGSSSTNIQHGRKM